MLAETDFNFAMILGITGTVFIVGLYFGLPTQRIPNLNLLKLLKSYRLVQATVISV